MLGVSGRRRYDAKHSFVTDSLTIVSTMTSSKPSPYRHLGGSLPLEDQTYVVREGDQQLYEALQKGEFCYVLNSRQMGKSSLRVRTMQRLQVEGITCGVVDLSAMGTESTQSALYKGLAYRIMLNFRTV